ncbi:class I SAM-dependent methyltransferase [Leifsonia aquatica]|uniref:class I SAM-dependent methyltransferase n=1 Tax=Leifsonia aquatica TaxID=144185 RepID=UPI003812971A
MATDAEELWDDHADAFDEAADHGLRDPVVREAWRSLLTPLLPEPPARVCDLGCGTGSLSLLVAAAGLDVTGLDISTRMLGIAREKAAAAGVDVDFVHGDAADPPLPAASFDAVLSRHVLWSFSDPDAVLARWVALLRPGGRLILVEGSWSTGAGLTAEECRAAVLRHRKEADVQSLSADERLWGGPVDDERYVIVSRS